MFFKSQGTAFLLSWSYLFLRKNGQRQSAAELDGKFAQCSMDKDSYKDRIRIRIGIRRRIAAGCGKLRQKGRIEKQQRQLLCEIC